MDANRRKKRLSKKTVADSSPKRVEHRQTKSTIEMVRGWFRRHPVFLFLTLFAVLVSVFYAITLTSFIEGCFPYYLGFNARLAGYILRLLGQNITVRGASIFSPAFSVTIVLGCEALEPIVLFTCAVLAFPAAFSKKIVGIVAGTLLLAILNLVRIVTLFLVGVYLPSVFQLMHLDVWQGVFMFFAILFWVLWILWTGKSQTIRQNP
jgi:exosortase/archaeosortase family protein